MKTVLTVSELGKTYTTKNIKYQVLKDVNMKVYEGEFVSVMGPSGSGKTTLLNIISGFLGTDKGSVYLGKSNLLNASNEELADIRQTKMGFIFQDYMLIDGLTVKENIMLPQVIAGKEIEKIQCKTDDLLGKMGIQDIEDKYPSDISGGQKQRTAIARALSNNPLLVLADEPTGNLDSKSAQDVIDAFQTARAELEATIVMVTHDAVAASNSDRIIALSDGRIVGELKREVSPRNFLDQVLGFMGRINGVDHEDVK